MNNSSFRLSWDFTNSRTLMGRMVTRRDERAWDVYLYLLKEQSLQAKSQLTIDTKNLARSLGWQTMGRNGYRRQIYRILKKLDQGYGLLRVSTEYNKEPEVWLADYQNAKKPYRQPFEKAALIPMKYWVYGWNRVLSFPAKVTLLLNFSYQQISPTWPVWHASLENLSRRHFISKWFIATGTAELKRRELLDVRYAELGKHGPKKALANEYEPKKLYNPQLRQKALKKLADQYGAARYRRAAEAAKLIYRDFSYEAIKDILLLEKHVGERVMRRAIRVIRPKNPNNPKRCLDYLIGTALKIGRSNN